jgi:hypothetical protein
MPRQLILLVALVSATAVPANPEETDKILHVGPARDVKRISDAARIARDGDIVEVDAGEYVGDVAVWSQKRLTIRAGPGRARLIAAGASAEGKAIWVIRGDEITVKNFEFTGAKVPDRNGAGIRHETGKLIVKNCVFAGNENGILVGNDKHTTLEIEDSEFVDNGAGDGQSHNLYVGTIAKFSVKGSYFHRARFGHLLKTRARENLITYNRLTDEYDGRASYELEFPSGGIAIVLGNLIEQSEHTENSTIVAFGTEGYRWPDNELYFAFNTVANDRAKGGVFVAIRPGAAPVKLVDNLFVGKGAFQLIGGLPDGNSVRPDWSDFVRAQRLDFRLRRDSKLIGTAVTPGTAHEYSLLPTQEYAYPVGTQPIQIDSSLSPGAFQTLGP